MRIAVAFALILVCTSVARAQDPPPPIGPFVIDLHGTVPRFPQDSLLAASRAMSLTELPGPGLGVQLGVHVYVFRWRAITFGAGGEFATSRSRKSPAEGQASVRAAEETFRSLAPQLSFNFGTGHGWSYLSGGLSRSTWSIVPDGQLPIPGDSAKLKTLNYGGGARWFAKTHVAFSVDVRLYAINPGPPNGPDAGSPRTTLMVIGAGVSVK